MDSMSFKSFAVALVLALPALGAEPPLPTLRIEPMTAGSVLFVKNVSTQPLTGYAIELVGYPGSFFALWRDEITGDPIAPGKEKRIQVSNMTVGAASDYVKVQGAIYADGSTAGVKDRLEILLDRRRFSLTTVRDLVRRMEAGVQAGMAKEAIAANLERAGEFLGPVGKMDRINAIQINRAAARDLISEAGAYLGLHSVDQTLVMLRRWEKTLAESKPAL